MANIHRSKTYGAEIEKPIASTVTSAPHKVTQQFFKSLAKEARKRGTFQSFHKSDIKSDVVIGATSYDLGEQGLDNGFNLLETSLPYQRSLINLQNKMLLDLKTVQKALEQEYASVINLSINPLAKRTMTDYKTYVAPKGVYPYFWYRGWDHTAGIDARAQNSPTIGVKIDKAADSVSVIIGAGAAFIGLFANSPYEEGKRSSYKESRSTMWDRMMKNSKVKGDITTAQFPQDRFKTMAQYFNWMFGGNTSIHFILSKIVNESDDYKGVGSRILVVKGNPSVLEYLSKPEWKASFLKDAIENKKSTVTVKPTISHMETMQFAQFSGARIRYKLTNHNDFPIQEFVKACKNPDSRKVENIFSEYSKYVYIEGRDAGANFPDQELWALGKDIASSVVISPSALQAGLIQNLNEATKYIDSFKWLDLKMLREAAIKDGLQGKIPKISVYEFTEKILEIASDGLTQKEQKFLAYPRWVMKTKKNGADRAIEFVEKQKGNLEKSLKELIKLRKVVVDI